MNAFIILILWIFLLSFFLYKLIQTSGKIKRQYRLLNFRGEGSFFGLMKNYFLMALYVIIIIFFFVLPGAFSGSSGF